ncbi:MAG: hypothetical protein DRM98_04540, partial [Thermoplasmata archaeon]
MISLLLIMFLVFPVSQFNNVKAGSYDGQDLAMAILANQSTYVSSSYWDRDRYGCRQAAVLSSKGTMNPTNGSTFIILSTGIAGADIVTTGGTNPGSERGTWFKNRYGYPRDKAVLTLVLRVPQHMHYLYYDFQFFSAEYPEYVGSRYNDKFEVTVNSPSKGVSKYVCDVNSGNFVLDSNYIPGTGFDIFARSGNPNNVDYVDTTPRNPGADAGATALITRGGESHPVSPLEEVTVTFSIKDVGDNQFDSAVFIDNLVFSGYARTDILARKDVEDLNGEPYEPGDTVKYTVTISNIGNLNQVDNPGNEFEDLIPENTTYVPGSATATSGTIDFNDAENKIIWNGEIPSESSVVLTYEVTVNESLHNGTIISNQGSVFWDSDEDHVNDAVELTDDISVDDGIDLDGDGETDDDDPTNFSIVAFEPPSTATEDFSDDEPGGIATQSYFTRTWFETETAKNSNSFEVVPDYHYSTSKAFKTQIRASSGVQYWNYTLSELESDLSWWEIMFACGNTSEEADLYLTFKDEGDHDIAKLKFEYTQAGTELPTDWVLKLYYWSPTYGWERLHTNYTGWYLYNGWYKIRIEKNGNNLNYSLY